MRPLIQSVTATTLVCLALAHLIHLSPLASLTLVLDANSDLRDQLKPLEPCVLRSIYSFTYAPFNPPLSGQQLDESCKRQAAALKCIKDGSKTVSSALIKRGLIGFAAGRQRVNRKYCANVNGDQSKKFVQDYRCLSERQRSIFKAAEIEYANTILEIQRRNYNDSRSELNQFCCATYKYRRGLTELEANECQQARATLVEVMNSIVPSEIGLLCDEEDKLAKVCAKLEPMRVSKEIDSNSQSAVTAGLYLVATLGEPEVANKQQQQQP